jgi:hypothetical protein
LPLNPSISSIVEKRTTTGGTRERGQLGTVVRCHDVAASGRAMCSENCCWVGSKDSEARLKPDGGCHGYLKFKGKRHWVSCDTIMVRLASQCEEEATRMRLLLPRGVFTEQSEREALSDALCAEVLPSYNEEVEEAQHCCRQCWKEGQKKMSDLEFLIPALRRIFGDDAVQQPPAAAGAAAASPAVATVSPPAVAAANKRPAGLAVAASNAGHPTGNPLFDFEFQASRLQIFAWPEARRLVDLKRLLDGPVGSTGHQRRRG